MGLAMRLAPVRLRRRARLVHLRLRMRLPAVRRRVVAVCLRLSMMELRRLIIMASRRRIVAVRLRLSIVEMPAVRDLRVRLSIHSHRPVHCSVRRLSVIVVEVGCVVLHGCVPVLRLVRRGSHVLLMRELIFLAVGA